MAPKRKQKQISNYDEKSNRSSKSNSNEEEEKTEKKRMKKTDTTEDLKVVFESNRKQNLFKLPSRGLK